MNKFTLRKFAYIMRFLIKKLTNNREKGDKLVCGCDINFNLEKISLLNGVSFEIELI